MKLSTINSRSRSIGAALAGAVLLALANTVTAAAAQPVRGCGDGFAAAMTFYEFVDFAVSLGNDPSLYPPQPGSGWMRADRNGDGVLCIVDLPNNPGTLFGLAFNAVDNAANR